MKVTVKNEKTQIVTNTTMAVGEMGKITSPKSFEGEVVIRVYEMLVSLSNLENTWDTDTFPNMEIELLPKGTEIILITE